MNDELEQLLRRADANAPAPEIDVANLPGRVRRTARNQRRLAACGLAIFGLAIIVSAIVFLPLPPGEGRGEGGLASKGTTPPPNTPSPQPSPGGRGSNTDTFAREIALHSQTAQLLESWEHHPAPKIDPTDAFLANLASQRNQTALLLIHNADHQLSADNRDAAVATLRKTVALFPDTPAASRANKQLELLELRSQL